MEEGRFQFANPVIVERLAVDGAVVVSFEEGHAVLFRYAAESG